MENKKTDAITCHPPLLQAKGPTKFEGVVSGNSRHALASTYVIPLGGGQSAKLRRARGGGKEANKPHPNARIGTGLGDSGGPTFWVNNDGSLVLVALTSGGNLRLIGTNIPWRVDIPETRDFINDVIASLESPAQR